MQAKSYTAVDTTNLPTLLPQHVTITGYAKKRDIDRKTVYNAIGRGDIIPDLIGQAPDQFILIDWEKYKEVPIRVNKPRDTQTNQP
jgi:hypothetical protein